MLVPREALENFRRLTEEGAEGQYGFYEAIDYTPERLPKGKRSVVVRSYMAHHQGMSLVALANALLDEPCPAGSTPSRWSGPSSCCCRSASPATRRSIEPLRRPTSRADRATPTDRGRHAATAAADEPAADDAGHARRRGRTCSRTPSTT